MTYLKSLLFLLSQVVMASVSAQYPIPNLSIQPNSNWVSTICSSTVPTDACHQQLQSQSYLMIDPFLHINQHAVPPNPTISHLYIELSLEYPLQNHTKPSATAFRQVIIPLYSVAYQEGRAIKLEISEGHSLLRTLRLFPNKMPKNLAIHFYWIPIKEQKNYLRALNTAQRYLNKISTTVLQASSINNSFTKGITDFAVPNLNYSHNCLTAFTQKKWADWQKFQGYLFQLDSDTKLNEKAVIQHNSKGQISLSINGIRKTDSYFFLGFQLEDYVALNDLPSTLVSDVNCTRVLSLDKIKQAVYAPYLSDYQHQLEKRLFTAIKPLAEKQTEVYQKISTYAKAKGVPLEPSLAKKVYGIGDIKTFLNLYEYLLIEKQKLYKLLQGQKPHLQARYISRIEQLQSCFENLFDLFGLGYKRIKSKYPVK